MHTYHHGHGEGGGGNLADEEESEEESDDGRGREEHCLLEEFKEKKGGWRLLEGREDSGCELGRTCGLRIGTRNESFWRETRDQKRHKGAVDYSREVGRKKERGRMSGQRALACFLYYTAELVGFRYRNGCQIKVALLRSIPDRS